METVYYGDKGRVFTKQTLELAKTRAAELGIRNIVLPTSHGYTAIESARIFAGTEIRITAVSLSGSFQKLGWCLTPEERQAVEKAGIFLLSGSFPAFETRNEKDDDVTKLAEALRWFSQGTKVAVEISIMTAEAGLIKPGEEIIALGGTDGGVDTAIVLRPACIRQQSEVKILEFLCKPRVG